MKDQLLADLILDHICSKIDPMNQYAWEYAREKKYTPYIMWIVKPQTRFENRVKYKVCLFVGPKSPSSGRFRFLYINVLLDSQVNVWDTDTTDYANGKDPLHQQGFLHSVDRMNPDILWAA